MPYEESDSDEDNSQDVGGNSEKVLTSKELSEQVSKYEALIEDKLKVDLERVESSRNKVFDKIAEYLQLKTSLQAIQQVTGIGEVKDSDIVDAANAASTTTASATTNAASATADSASSANESNITRKAQKLEPSIIPGSSNSSLKTMVDLGCNYYIQAEIADPSKVFVDIGYHFFAELTIPEALAFIDRKVDHLNKFVQPLTKKSSEIKANIKFVLQALQNLQMLSQPVNRQNRVF